MADRRQQFEALAAPGAPLRLLAEEQLALIEVAEGNVDAAIERLQRCGRTPRSAWTCSNVLHS